MTENTTKPANPNMPFIIWMSVSTLVIIFDQLSKQAIVKWVDLHPPAVDTFLSITRRCNEGAAFSFLANAGGWQRWFFVALALSVSCLLVVWLWRLRKEAQYLLSAGLALVLGGAIGNVIDRIVIGCVVDFVRVDFGSWEFPAFNFADAAISVGAAFLIYDALFLSGREEPRTRSRRR